MSATREWALLQRTTLLRHGVIALAREDRVNPRTGAPWPFFVIDLPDWVNVVAITPDDEIVLVRQWRVGTGASSVELPGGVVDPGEAPEAAARRELLEETGFTALEFVPLGQVHPNPALQSNRCFFFLARGATRQAEQSLDAGEDVAVELTPLVELAARLGPTGDITHALAHVALGRARLA